MSIPKKDRIYLTEPELVNVYPQNVKVYKIATFPRYYECYSIGYEPPLTRPEPEIKGECASWWFDLLSNKVKLWNSVSEQWDVEPTAPRYAFNLETHFVVGQVEDDE